MPFGDLDVTPLISSSVKVLWPLYRVGGEINITELAKLTGMKHKTLKKRLETLESWELVKVVEEKNRKIIKLTLRGASACSVLLHYVALILKNEVEVKCYGKVRVLEVADVDEFAKLAEEPVAIWWRVEFLPGVAYVHFHAEAPHKDGYVVCVRTRTLADEILDNLGIEKGEFTARVRSACWKLVEEFWNELRRAGCDLITLGRYLVGIQSLYYETDKVTKKAHEKLGVAL